MPAKLYHWDRWFLRGSFALRRGVDFRCSLISMAQQVRQAASNRGLGTHIVERGQTLEVTVLKEEKTCPASP